LPDKLGRLMSEFSARVRRYRNVEYAHLGSIAKLAERDIAILELVYAKGKATFGEIAEELKMAAVPRSSASTVSQAISALYAEHGLVEKRPSREDQRQPEITLTEKGREAVEKLHKMRMDMMMKIKEAMEVTDAESELLEAAFTRGIKNFDKILSE